MPQVQLLDGKKIPFTKSINGFEMKFFFRLKVELEAF